MSKTGSVASETAAPHVEAGGIPRWALLTGAVLLAAGAIALATREARARGSAVSALSEASVKVKNAEDGLADNFAEVYLESHRRAYEELLGDCRTDPERALDVYRRLLTDGARGGRILALRMAFFLARDGRLKERADFERVPAELDHSNADVRAVAQWTLGQLIALRDPARGPAFEQLPPPPDAKTAWVVRTKEAKLTSAHAADGKEAYETVKFLTVRWSAPGACKAWWVKFGSGAKWDEALQRWVLDAP